MTQWQHTTTLTITPKTHNKNDPKILETITPPQNGHQTWLLAELSPHMQYKLTIHQTENGTPPTYELHIQGDFMPGDTYTTAVLPEEPQPFPRLEGP